MAVRTYSQLISDISTYLVPKVRITQHSALVTNIVDTLFAGSGGWTDDGTVVRLTMITDKVGIGTASPTYKLHVVESGTQAMLMSGVVATGKTLTTQIGNNILGVGIKGWAADFFDGTDRTTLVVGDSSTPGIGHTNGLLINHERATGETAIIVVGNGNPDIVFTATDSTGDLHSNINITGTTLQLRQAQGILASTTLHTRVDFSSSGILIQAQEGGGEPTVFNNIVVDLNGVTIKGRDTNDTYYALKVLSGDDTNYLSIRNDGRCLVGELASTTYLLVDENVPAVTLVANGYGFSVNGGTPAASINVPILNLSNTGGITTKLADAIGSNIASGIWTFSTAAATGNSTSGGYYSFLTSDPIASGVNPQSVTEKVRLTKSGDIVVLNSANGLVLKDAAGTPHYWRISVSTLGVLSTADLGTTVPL